jgi:hypothetical protein
MLGTQNYVDFAKKSPGLKENCLLSEMKECPDDKKLAHFYRIKEFLYFTTEVMLLDIEWREGTFMQLRWSSRWNAKAVIKIGLPVRQFFFQPLHLPLRTLRHGISVLERLFTRIMRKWPY